MRDYFLISTPILHSCQYRNFLKKVVRVSPTVLTTTKNRAVGDESEASGRPLRELTEWEERHQYERNHENEPSSQPTGTHL